MKKTGLTTFPETHIQQAAKPAEEFRSLLSHFAIADTLQLPHYPRRWHFKCFPFEKPPQWELINGLLYLKRSKCHPDQINLRPTISNSGIDKCLEEVFPLMV